LISASETINERGIREVMRVTSKKRCRSPQNQTVAVKPVILKKNSLNSKAKKKE
jgi:hypothetical protein